MDLSTTPIAFAPAVERRVRTASNGDDVPADAPDAFIIDLADLTESDPLRLCRETVRASPSTAVIAVGPVERLADGFQLLRLGAISWFDSDADVTASMDAVLRGETILAPRHAAWILADFATMAAGRPTSDPRFRVTATEREVLTRLAKGQTPEHIASFHDVDTHVVNRQVRLALTRLHRHR